MAGNMNDVAKVIVAVGTDHHPFDRLVEWIDEWAALHPDVAVLVQRGSSLPTADCPSVELLPHAELCQKFSSAVAVVSHGGPSTVMDARKAGRLPIVFARNPEYDEHVDDHQMRFAEHLRVHDLAVVVDDRQALHDAIDEALDNPKHFTIPVENATIPGVVEFGRMLDNLLQTETSLVPSIPTLLAEPVPGLPADPVLPADPTPNLERNSA